MFLIHMFIFDTYIRTKQNFAHLKKRGRPKILGVVKKGVVLSVVHYLKEINTDIIFTV